jgi:5-methylcytosine-specific restriction endonuclease McrA
MSVTHVPAELRRLVVRRADQRCEYCRIPESVTFAPLEIDHIYAEKHGGTTEPENLGLSCPLCNRRKGTDLASIDPQTGAIVPLFHPRRDRWSDHFRLKEGHIEPLTAAGRVTVHLLQLNQPERVEERLILVEAGLLS